MGTVFALGHCCFAVQCHGEKLLYTSWVTDTLGARCPQDIYQLVELGPGLFSGAELMQLE